MNTALLLVDIQNDYFPGGRNELFHPDQALTHAQEALSLFREKNLPIVHIQCILLEDNAAFFSPIPKGSTFMKAYNPNPTNKSSLSTRQTAFSNGTARISRIH